MAFKMKGPSLYPKYNKKWGSPLHEEKVTSDKGDNDVQTGDITWDKEELTSDKTTKNERGGTKNVKTYTQTGKSKGKKVEKQLDKNDPDYEKKLEAWKNAPEENKAKYRDKTHVRSRTEESETKKPLEPIKIKPIKPKLIPVDDDPKPVEIKTPPKDETPPPTPPEKDKPKRPRKKRKIDIIPGNKNTRRRWRRNTAIKIKRGIKKLNPFRKKEKCTRWW